MQTSDRAILHDEQVYPDPEEFKPERFLKDGKLDPDVLDPALVGQFGYGRRACPGKYVATNSVWITVASILASMDITESVDEHGSFIKPSGEMKGSMLQCVYPTPIAVACRLTLTLPASHSLSNAASNPALPQSPAQSSQKLDISGTSYISPRPTYPPRASNPYHTCSRPLFVIVMRAFRQPAGSKAARAKLIEKLRPRTWLNSRMSTSGAMN